MKVREGSVKRNVKTSTPQETTNVLRDGFFAYRPGLTVPVAEPSEIANARWNKQKTAKVRQSYPAAGRPPRKPGSQPQTTRVDGSLMKNTRSVKVRKV